MLKTEKSANRKEHQNGKTEKVFWAKNFGTKTEKPIKEIAKTENPNVPP